MTPPARLVALSIALGLVIGPLAPPLGAQAPAPPTASPPAPAGSRASAGATAGAVAVNIIRVPGKALLCGLGSVAAGGLMILTFGTQYRAAGAAFREGCGGKWVIGPSDLDRDVDAPRAIFSRGSP